MDRANLYAEIVKADQRDDGTLDVYGRVSNDRIDVDEQIADREWLKTALPDWMRWANVREMHGHIAAGVGRELTEADDGFWLKSHIVDPGSVAKVKAGVLKGYSIGIRRPQIVSDKAARGGRIVGGSVIEVSLVDHPSNGDCSITVCKGASPGMIVKGEDFDADRMLVRVEELHETPDADLAKAPEADAPEGDPVEVVPEAPEVPAVDAPAEPSAAVEPVEPVVPVDAPAVEAPAVEAEPAAAAEPVVAPELAGTVDDGLGKAADTVPDSSGVEAVVAKAIAAALPGLIEAELAKRDFTASDRKRLTASGAAMAGGGFPVATVGDLKNAIQAIGRAKNPAAAKAHIKERARVLGRDDLIPDEWKGADPDLGKAPGADEMAHDVDTLRAVRDGLLNLLIAEAQEALAGEREEWDLSCLVDTLAQFLAWWDHETFEGEAPASSDVKSVDADLTKTTDTVPDPAPALVQVPEQTPTEPVGTTAGVDTVKAAVAEALAPLRQENEDLRARLAVVEKQAAPGGPVRTPTLQQRQVSVETDGLRAKAAQLRAVARTVDDHALRQEYEKRATTVEDELRKLAGTN